MLWSIWVIMLSLGCLFLVLSLILIFALKIPDSLDELSGRKAKRQIKRLKELNVGTGSLSGMATEDIYSTISSGSLLSEELKVQPVPEIVPNIPVKDDDIATSDMGENVRTDFIEDENDNIATSYVEDSDATTLLADIQNYCESKKIIVIVEEQSSL